MMTLSELVWQTFTGSGYGLAMLIWIVCHSFALLYVGEWAANRNSHWWAVPSYFVLSCALMVTLIAGALFIYTARVNGI